MKRKSGLPIAAVPDDVRAEVDAEERRRGVAASVDANPAAPGAIPEDVLGELDLEARRAEMDLQARLSEGRPPAEDDPLA